MTPEQAALILDPKEAARVARNIRAAASDAAGGLLLCEAIFKAMSPTPEEGEASLAELDRLNREGPGDPEEARDAYVAQLEDTLREDALELLEETGADGLILALESEKQDQSTFVVAAGELLMVANLVKEKVEEAGLLGGDGKKAH